MSDFNLVSTAANRIQLAMDECGKTQADLMRETGLNKGTISRYLSGKYEPKLQAISKLAESLDVAELWLWGYDVPKERPLEEKKSDNLHKIVALLKSDPGFFDMVYKLSELSEVQRDSIKELLSAFVK